MNHREYLFYLLRITEYLEENFRAPFDPEKMAEYARYSPWHCNRIFREYTGESIADRLTRLRLEEGKKELRRGRTVAEAARAVGYSTREGFAKAFTAAYGVPPGEYARGGATKERYRRSYEYRMTPEQWSRGRNPTADGLWEFEYFDRRTDTFHRMIYNPRFRYFEAPYRRAEANTDPTYYCRSRSEGYGLHPGGKADAARSFLCPYGGEVEFFISLGRTSGLHDGSNPCAVRIYHGSVPLLPEESPVILSDREPVFLKGTVRVKAGDRIRIVLNAMGHIGRDGTVVYRQQMGYLTIDEKP